MKLRRTVATAAASLMAVAALAPAASASTSSDDLNLNLDINWECAALGLVLDQFDLLNDGTTYSQLIDNINNSVDSTLAGVAAIPVADRALACGLISEDPLLSGGSSQAIQGLSSGSSLGSSTLGLPEISPNSSLGSVVDLLSGSSLLGLSSGVSFGSTLSSDPLTSSEMSDYADLVSDSSLSSE
ncbi:hypothetical protein [Corynebacterium alimapuense]|nr:hypothetical protein [Corynebacterium alimapuense]